MSSQNLYNLIVFLLGTLIVYLIIIFFLRKKKSLHSDGRDENINKFLEITPNLDRPKISVLTYNILCQKFMKRSNRKDLNLHNRMTIVLREIKSLNPDIICVQETNWHTYKKYFLDYFLEYEFKYCDNYGSNFMNLVGYRKSRFEIISSKHLDLTDVKVEGNRGVVNVILKDRLSLEILCLYNVHFPWKPLYELEKLLIMKIIYHDFLRLGVKNVIIAGDFNSLPYSLVLKSVYIHHFIQEINISKEIAGEKKVELFDKYTELKNFLNESIKNRQYPLKLNDSLKFMETNFKSLIQLLIKKSTNYQNLFTPFIEAKQGLNISSAYGDYQILIGKKKHDNSYIHNLSYVLNHPRYTNYTEFFKNTIDYIFHSANLKRSKILILPEKEELALEGFLPSSKFPSDHIKLFAEFYYKNE
jgi:mRNA deadenylase 3'-5' endonuclease subunit Ccr4